MGRAEQAYTFHKVDVSRDILSAARVRQSILQGWIHGVLKIRELTAPTRCEISDYAHTVMG